MMKDTGQSAQILVVFISTSGASLQRVMILILVVLGAVMLMWGECAGDRVVSPPPCPFWSGEGCRERTSFDGNDDGRSKPVGCSVASAPSTILAEISRLLNPEGHNIGRSKPHVGPVASAPVCLLAGISPLHSNEFIVYYSSVCALFGSDVLSPRFDPTRRFTAPSDWREQGSVHIALTDYSSIRSTSLIVSEVGVRLDLDKTWTTNDLFLGPFLLFNEFFVIHGRSWDCLITLVSNSLDVHHHRPELPNKLYTKI